MLITNYYIINNSSATVFPDSIYKKITQFFKNGLNIDNIEYNT